MTVVKDKHDINMFVRHSFLKDTPDLIQWVAQDSNRMLLCMVVMENYDDAPVFTLVNELEDSCRMQRVTVEQLRERIAPVARSLGLTSSMSKEDYYGILGIAPDSDEARIRSAFRAKAHRIHPDKLGRGNPNTDKFINLNIAYQTLSDPELRRQYDLTIQTKEKWQEASKSSKPISNKPSYSKLKPVYQLSAVAIILVVCVVVFDVYYRNSSLKQGRRQTTGNSTHVKYQYQNNIETGESNHKQGLNVNSSPGSNQENSGDRSLAKTSTDYDTGPVDKFDSPRTQIDPSRAIETRSRKKTPDNNEPIVKNSALSADKKKLQPHVAVESAAIPDNKATVRRPEESVLSMETHRSPPGVNWWRIRLFEGDTGWVALPKDILDEKSDTVTVVDHEHDNRNGENTIRVGSLIGVNRHGVILYKTPQRGSEIVEVLPFGAKGRTTKGPVHKNRLIWWRVKNGKRQRGVGTRKRASRIEQSFSIPNTFFDACSTGFCFANCWTPHP